MTRNRTVVFPICILGLLGQVGRAQTSDLTPVVSKPLSRAVELPGELLPFLTVSACLVPGYVERVLVDRGSVVAGRPACRTERSGNGRTHRGS